MEYHFTSPILLYSFVALLSILFLLFLKGNKKSLTKLPPSPPGWPLFGHMFNLGTLPYATMAKMKEKYGPVIWLKIGSINTMAVLSANVAAELYKNHDMSFSDRLIVEILTSHDFHKSSMAFSPYGPYWRMLRRLCNAGLNSKINDGMVHVRRKCVDDMITWIGKEAETAGIEKRGIEIVDFLFLANVNVIGNILFSRDLAEPNSKTGSELFASVTGFFHLCGEPNVSDLFSWLKPFDLQGLKKKMDRDLGKAMEIVARIVKERLEEKHKGGEKQRNDLLDVLLEFKGHGSDEQEKLSEHTILVFLLELFLAAMETTAHTTEWALAELLCDPEKMIAAKNEIRKILGKNRRFDESDIDNLPFLQAIVKETLRLHPPVVLIPKKASKDTVFMGYEIPKSTHVMVNLWAIGRDSEYWSDPLSFKPERRICPGLPIAHRLLPLLLGSLLHEFDWELFDSLPLDMSEKMGLTVRKLKPLRVIPRKRSC
ncbi:oxygenase [Lithospermum erythrorhizon]|uniref:Oxygenase n=1 Tax=Lithospermum erythrorhizon TaxID=34254 RepID=A0AAV3PDH2_LITER